MTEPMSVARAAKGLALTKQASEDLPSETNYWKARIAYWESELARAKRAERDAFVKYRPVL